MKKITGMQFVWLRSFLIIITFVMAFLLAFFFFVRINVEQEALDKNDAESRFVKNIIDDKFSSLPFLAADVARKPKTMLPLHEGAGSLTSLDMYSLANELRSFRVSNSVLKDVFIYYPQYDHVVGQYGSYKTSSYYFLKNFELDPLKLQKWESDMLNTQEQGFFFYPGEGGPVLMYCRSLVVGREKETLYRIFFEIDQAAVTQILEQSNAKNPHQLVALLGNETSAYAYAGNPDLLQYISHVDLAASFSNQREGDHFITYQKSEIKGINYLMVSSKSDVLRLSTNITYVLLIILVTSLAASLVLAFFFSAKNAKPINLLLKKVQDSSTEDVSNPLDYINRKVNDMMVKNSSALEQLEEQQKLLTATFVQIVVGTDTRSEKTVSTLSELYGLSLENRYFCVLILSFANGDAQEKYRLKTAEMDAYLAEQGKPNFAVLSGSMSDQLVLILNYDCEGDFGGVVTDFIKEFFDWIQKKGISGRISAGGIYQSATELALSYAEAQHMLDQASTDWKFYEKGQQRPISGSGSDGRTLFADFQQYVLARDYEKADDILDSLIETYLLDCNPSEMKYRKHALINQLYDAVLVHAKDQEQGELMAEQCRELLFSIGTTKECRENMHAVLNRLTGMTGQKAEHDDSIAHKARMIIDNTYANPMLGLTSISDQLGVSASYISRVFKRQYDYGVVEYSSRVRIAHAKTLIAKGEMNVKAIALSVGFSSDVSFIRVFKKYENTTPGKYTGA